MKKTMLLASLVLILPLASSAKEILEQKTEVIIVEPPPCEMPKVETTAIDLMQRSATCLDEKKTKEAVPIYFAGQIRLRTLAILDKNPSGAQAMLSSFTYMFGPAINGWAGGDIPEWMIALGQAIEWDKKTPFKELDEVALRNFRNVSEAKTIHERVNASMYVLIGKIRDDREKIYLRRDEQNFIVRDPWWTNEQKKSSKKESSHDLTYEQVQESLMKKEIKKQFESGNMNLIDKKNEDN